MKADSVSRRRVLKTLAAGVLSYPLVAPVSTSLLGQIGAEKERAGAEVLTSIGNPKCSCSIEPKAR